MSRNDRVSRWGLMAIAVAMAATAAVAQNHAAPGLDTANYICNILASWPNAAVGNAGN